MSWYYKSVGPLSDLQTVVQWFAVGKDLLVLQPSLYEVDGEHTCYPNNARYPSIDDLGNGSEILILKLMLFINKYDKRVSNKTCDMFISKKISQKDVRMHDLGY